MNFCPASALVINLLREERDFNDSGAEVHLYTAVQTGAEVHN